jgi:hypothetical protein
VLVLPNCAYSQRSDSAFESSALTRGPWHPEHQHAGPPSALVCRAIEQEARSLGLEHIGRLTSNLLRPVPIAPLQIQVRVEYAGRNAAHLAAELSAGDKVVARFTALAQRETTLELPEAVLHHPHEVSPPQECPACSPPFARPDSVGYFQLVEVRLASGTFFNGPCFVWFRLAKPLVDEETASAYQRVAVAADCGNGISTVLSFDTHVFVNSDLTINLLRRPRGEWIGLDAKTYLGHDGCGLAESALYDLDGRIGRATQNLFVRPVSAR